MKNKNEELKTLEIWHIDCFEGGVGSRYSLLKSLAREYSNKTNVILSVKSHTVHSAEVNFKKEIFPDVVSYGNGLNLPYERLLQVKEDEYILPWCSGGYLLISHKAVKANKVIISKQNYTIPKLALNMQGVTIPIKVELPSEKAIYEFCADKDCALLGTQRDLFRLERKNIDVDVTALCAFNDLYQYFSICGNEANLTLSRSFIEFVRNKCGQGCLKNVGMLMAVGYSEVGCDALLNCFSGVEFEYTTLPLISREQIEKVQKQVEDYEKEKESIKNALKRLK